MASDGCYAGVTQPLVRLVEQEKWIEAKEYVEMNPQAMPENMKLFSGSSVLHFACSSFTYPIGLIEHHKTVEESRQICDFVQSLFDVAFSRDDLDSSAKRALARSMLFCCDAQGCTPLHELLRFMFEDDSDDTALVKILLDSARKISPKTPFELVTAKSNIGFTVLHYIPLYCGPQNAELLMACCSEAPSEDPTLILDEDGSSILQLASEQALSPRYWKLLLEHGAGGLVHPNKWGAFPIDVLFGEHGDDDDFLRESLCQILDLMLRAHFGKLEAASEDWFPLHALAQAPFCRPYVLKVILEMSDWSNQLLTFDRQGMLPLHKAAAQPIPELLLRANQTPLASKELSALQTPSAQKALEELRYYLKEPMTGTEMTEGENNMILLLLNARPEAAAEQATTGGRLALHYAIESGHVWEAVRQLWKAYPDSVHTIDPKTRLFPFMLAASAPENPSSGFERKSNGGLDVIFELVRNRPELLQSGIPKHFSP